jgi:hypothetical protein
MGCSSWPHPRVNLEFLGSLVHPCLHPPVGQRLPRGTSRSHCGRSSWESQSCLLVFTVTWDPGLGNSSLSPTQSSTLRQNPNHRPWARPWPDHMWPQPKDPGPRLWLFPLNSALHSVLELGPGRQEGGFVTRAPESTEEMMVADHQSTNERWLSIWLPPQRARAQGSGVGGMN